MKLRNWTPFVFLRPVPYLSKEPKVLNLDLEEWSKKYKWEQDEWNGWLDFAQSPEKTVRTGRGDCEDYALVIASWAYQRGYEVTIGLCFEGYSPIPAHVAVYFDGKTYTSGDIQERTLRSYVERSKYDWHLSRTIQK